MDRERMERCLEQVAAYRASGLKGNAWAEANGQRRAAEGVVELVCPCAALAGAVGRCDGVDATAQGRRLRRRAHAWRGPRHGTRRTQCRRHAGRTALACCAPRELAAWLREVGR